MSTELVKVTIDGMQVEVPKGTMIIEAAKQAGVLVPHYCYHPSLPSPAVCRMCLVEVEKAPKLAPACVTAVAEGQVVHVNSDAAKKAREGVLELLLINHPLDCPICDQAGECELQDYVFQEGRAGTRYSEYAKRYSPVETFGPDVLYVPNRCILCTRCVRFMEDVAKDPVLNVSERGDRAFIGIDPDHELNHAWSGNVVDLCPVGSLISKDFLHKARAWDLDKTASICPGCSQGCNMMIDTRDNTVVRLRPRPNLEVNRHFMCDHGRSSYRWMNRGDRIEAPLVLEGNKHHAVDWDTALERLARLIKDTSGPALILANGSASTEALGMVKALLKGRSVTAAVSLPQGAEAPLAGVPNLALRAERAANGQGARMLGYSDNISAAITSAARATLIIVLDLELSAADINLLAPSPALVIMGTVATDADLTAQLVLPTTNLAEENGTFVNRDGRVQRYTQAKAARGMARPAWWVAAEAIGILDAGSKVPSTAAEAFDRVAADTPGLGGIRAAEIGLTGRVSSAARPAGVAG
ncbi:MAG TPA: 2Fe-2S iron-sulfur cluster-binding protein [Gemmatimonadales bacterium]|nr:2Fe-2S iron-sulfur cluster-binding protein [Gemmatimonadales bacterium]